MAIQEKVVRAGSQDDEYEQRLEEILAPEIEPPGPRIVYTTSIDGEPWYGIELPHNSYPADPNSSCNGTVKIHFGQHQKGEREVPCWGCKQEKVKVSISSLRLGLGLME
ncbi:hypothetical protein HY385_02265 [Candidatus Daviesbacteria bacterium]|nr:hypothetical protein [Candidatus Daviesbacteria bacterium]